MADEIWVVELDGVRGWRPLILYEKERDAQQYLKLRDISGLRYRRFVAADSINIEAEAARKYMREHTEG